MESIRNYDGPVFLCGHCAQPAYESTDVGHSHFREQWDGVQCPRFPLAGPRVEIEWDQFSLQTLKQSYPSTYPEITFGR